MFYFAGTVQSTLYIWGKMCAFHKIFLFFSENDIICTVNDPQNNMMKDKFCKRNIRGTKNRKKISFTTEYVRVTKIMWEKSFRRLNQFKF